MQETRAHPGSDHAGEAPARAARIGDFAILGVLGQGGMGTVYLAEDVRLRRKAAIKIMKPELAAIPENRERFAREGRAAAAVEHDHVVPVWQVGESADGCPFIAMPFLQGETLESRLRRQPAQPLALILKVACEVAQGLAAAHGRGLIHRDVKSGNVWLEGDPTAPDLARQVQRCKILDFGLARSLGAQDVQVTTHGAVLGTPAYMAPEQARGEPVDQRADLFSLGVLLYQMATGRLPFRGRTTMAVLTALATVTPPPARTLNKDLPQALSDLIDRLLSKDPNGRPRSAEETEAAVRHILQDQAARPSLPAEAAARPREPEDESDTATVPRLSDTTVRVKSAAAPRPGARTAPGRLLLLGVLGLLALAPLFWWLATVLLPVKPADRNPLPVSNDHADGTLFVEMDDPETEAQFRNGQLILIGPDDKVCGTLSSGERDRKIAAGTYRVRVEGANGLTTDKPEFMLPDGGRVVVRVRGEPKAPSKAPDPDRQAARFVLSLGGSVRVNGQNREVRMEADLPPEPFRLTWVNLSNNKQVNDADLAHLRDCTNLTGLTLDGTLLGDAGLVHFKDHKALTFLSLPGTLVSDAGLAHFKDCNRLTFLSLDNTQVGDVGLANFRDCKNLTFLSLGGTRVTDRGLIPFKECKNLSTLGLQRTSVGNAGLANFKECRNLTILDLENTQVDDEGMAHFKDCKTLTGLILSGTRVTDTGLAYFKDCRGLWNLDLGGTKIGDAGLAQFKDCTSLQALCLNGTQVTDTGLAQFKGCKNLNFLKLNGTQVGDAGVACFEDCPRMTYLNLQQTKVTAAKVERLKKVWPQCVIEGSGM
jgi:serine/threonine protein kinase/Leucine-rich repeat (LRR) protein